MKLSKKFWNNKTVLITGHTGFKGRWLSIILKNLKSKVFGISLKEKKNFKKKEFVNLLNKNGFYVDINNYIKVKKILKKINPEIIIHLAAQSKVITSYQDPISTFKTNIMGSVNILECATKLKKIKTILIVTSDKVYENTKNNKFFSEDDKLGGDDPYSASKASIEVLLNFYRKFYPNIQIISVRAGNIIGGDDWGENRIIPDAIKSLGPKKTLTLRNPKFSRPWQYILDVLIEYLEIIEKSYKIKKMPKIFNIGPSTKSNLTVERLILKLCKFFPNLKYKYNKNKQNLEKKHIYLNTKRSMKFLNKEKINNIEELIERTASVYKEILLKKNIKKVYLKEINSYLKK